MSDDQSELTAVSEFDDEIQEKVLGATRRLQHNPPKPIKRRHVPAVVVRRDGRVFFEVLNVTSRWKNRRPVVDEGVQVVETLTKYIKKAERALVCELPQAPGTLLVFSGELGNGFPEMFGVPPEDVREYVDLSLGLASIIRCAEVPAQPVHTMLFDQGQHHPVVASTFDPAKDFSQHDHSYYQSKALAIMAAALKAYHKSLFPKYRHKVAAITLDEDFRPTVTWLVATAGGKSSTATYFTGKPELLSVLRAAWPEVPADQFDKEERHLFLSRFGDFDVVLVAPDVVPAELAAKLGLAVVEGGDGEEGAFAIKVRFTCGKRQVGGSRPQLGKNKVDLLFPDGLSAQDPAVVTKDAAPRKRQRGGQQQSKGIARVAQSLRRLPRDTRGLNDMLEMLAALDDLKSERASEMVESMASLDPNTCYQMFSNPSYLRSLATACGLTKELEPFICRFVA